MVKNVSCWIDTDSLQMPTLWILEVIDCCSNIPKGVQH